MSNDALRQRDLAPDEAIISGRNPAVLSNAVSDAIHAALISGMQPDEAACVAVSVAADYARAAYGDAYLPGLARAIMAQHGRPLPGEDDGR